MHSLSVLCYNKPAGNAAVMSVQPRSKCVLSTRLPVNDLGIYVQFLKLVTYFFLCSHELL